jgi:hypothetical protein
MRSCEAQKRVQGMELGVVANPAIHEAFERQQYLPEIEL